MRAFFEIHLDYLPNESEEEEEGVEDVASPVEAVRIIRDRASNLGKQRRRRRLRPTHNARSSQLPKAADRVALGLS